MTDTNILMRCSQGQAMKLASKLAESGIRLSTTAQNIAELRRKLIDVFELGNEMASKEAERISAYFDIILPEAFEHLRTEAEARLSVGGKSDWPALAAAMAFGGAVWTDDRDFFGVGVPVWSSGNVRFAEVDQ